ncbi:MAG TPA: hypothetical protein VIM98_07860 [Dyella sp.]|uniref:hypothetical protein n=1 Tax=Dyella sp. TaxID=1869338 RepID=UPI002F953B06
MIAIRQKARLLRAAFFAVFACLSLSGCISAKMYVDSGLPNVSKSDLPVAPHPEPVQVLFEFRTKGNANANATARIAPRVIAAATESGLFAQVSGTPHDGAGILKIVIDNVPLTDNAAAKGFGTGLTFGLAGSIVTDGYICTASYTRGGRTTETTVKHSIYTTIGNHEGPKGLAAMEPQAAVNLAMDQITWNALKQLADKHAFD